MKGFNLGVLNIGVCAFFEVVTKRRNWDLRGAAAPPFLTTGTIDVVYSSPLRVSAWCQQQLRQSDPFAMCARWSCLHITTSRRSNADSKFDLHKSVNESVGPLPQEKDWSGCNAISWKIDRSGVAVLQSSCYICGTTSWHNKLHPVRAMSFHRQQPLDLGWLENDAPLYAAILSCTISGGTDCEVSLRRVICAWVHQPQLMTAWCRCIGHMSVELGRNRLVHM